jgi:hypothetical protein
MSDGNSTEWQGEAPDYRSMFGNITPCVDRARGTLEDHGYEVLVFHATGTGGKTIESDQIEFVLKEAPKVQTLLATRDAIFSNYTQQGFEAAFSNYFTIQRTECIKDCSRILYLLEAKKGCELTVVKLLSILSSLLSTHCLTYILPMLKSCHFRVLLKFYSRYLAQPLFCTWRQIGCLRPAQVWGSSPLP